MTSSTNSWLHLLEPQITKKRRRQLTSSFSRSRDCRKNLRLHRPNTPRHIPLKVVLTVTEQLSEPTTLTTENEKFYENAISRNCVLQEQISALQGKLERITSENQQLIQNLAKASAEAEVGKQWMTVASSLQISSPEVLQTSLKLQEKRLSAATEKCTDLNKKLKKANNKLKNSQERSSRATGS
ncbi:hypothetical protein Pelo_19507 [Pelomyxa schiedti]|nr:hypothetical protein Pelo_19507 [Pelomyxa schiedti]